MYVPLSKYRQYLSRNGRMLHLNSGIHKFRVSRISCQESEKVYHSFVNILCMREITLCYEECPSRSFNCCKIILRDYLSKTTRDRLPLSLISRSELLPEGK